MKDWEEKRKIRNTLYSKWVIFILVIIIFLAVKGTYNLYQKSNEARINKERVTKQLQELESQQDFLENGLKQLDSQSGVEALIRQKFNVKKEGEEVAIIVTTEVKEEEVREGSIIGFFQSFFTGLADIFR